LQNDIKIIELCASKGLGGLELYFFRTTKFLQEHGYFCIPVVSENSRLKNRLDTHDINSIAIKRGLRYLPIFNALRLARIIDSESIDVVHMHWAKDLALAVLAKRFSKRKPKLIYTRQMEIYGDKHDWYHRFTYSQVDLILTITEQLATQARKILPLNAEKIRTLYYGIPEYDRDREIDREEFRNEFGIPHNAFLVGIVGRVEIGKRQKIFLDALDKLIDVCPDLHGIIIGGTANPDYVEKLKLQVINGRLNGKVSFLGFYEYPRKAMAAFDVAVLATKCETFGLVLIEAMSTGTPVIGSRACGVPEIIEENINGLMFEPDNVDDLSRKILQLYKDDSLRRRLAEKGKESTKARFIEETHYQHLINYFEQ